MAYERRQFRPVVDMPAPMPIESPLRSLHDLVSLAGSVQQYESDKRRVGDEDRARKGEQVTRDLITRLTDPVTGVPDYKQAVSELRTAGFPEYAAQVETNWQQEREKTWKGLTERVGLHKTLYGQSAEWLRGLEADPSRYPEIRPYLVDAASQISPELAQRIPEAYEPTRVRQMMDFVTQSAQELDLMHRSIAKADDARQRAADRVKQDNLFRESLATALAGATTPETWNQIRGGAQFQDFPKGIVDEFAEFSDENRAKARKLAGLKDDTPTNINAAILAAQQKGDQKEVDRLIGLSRRMADATRAPERAPRPESISAAQRAAAERWKQDALASLEARHRDPRMGPLTDAELTAEKARIQESYLVQLGEDPSRAGSSRATAGDVPPDVRSILAEEDDGEFELSDGSVWRKQGSSISKIR
jgi:hypothetical protein